MSTYKFNFVFLIFLSIIHFSCKCDKAQKVVGPATDVAPATIVEEEVISKIDADGNFIYEIGDEMELTLPDSTKMKIGENSTENKIYTQLNNPDFKVNEDKTKDWVSLDRVYFSTGKSSLTENSNQQINNLVKILKSYPTATIKIGGYTDNTGDAVINQKVSAERATTVAQQLIKGGIDAKRITSEGYGAQHFVYPANDTDECKAQNRRVDIRITKK